jgi:hypothetical protein
VLETEIVVEVTGAVLLHDVGEAPTAVSCSQSAGRLRGDPEPPLAAILGQPTEAAQIG